MNDTANNVIDARLSEALGAYFNGVTLQKTVGDCAILTGVRKQNSAPVSIYTPSFNVARDEAIVGEIAKGFAAYEKIGHLHLQATERLLTSRAFRKMPALAVLSCPVPVFDEAFDTLTVEQRLQVFDQILDGLAALHDAGLVHGNLSPDVLARETDGGQLRLTELTFSGDRATSVTSQPPIYQSRHVVNSAQPRLEDDVHAAGMLGYRILLGPEGLKRCLTGGAGDPEAVISAILSDEQRAPGAEELFPEGHPKAEQMSRLLERMTGRAANAAPYSNAGAARRALHTVLSGEEKVTPVAPRTDMAAPAQPMAPAMAAPAAQDGVSKGTALMLFSGFIVSLGAAAYYYMAEANVREERDQVFSELQTRVARHSEETRAQDALREADRMLAAAQAGGAGQASTAALDALNSARSALAAADAAFSETPFEASENASAAAEAARHAIALTKEAEASALSAMELAGEANGTALAAFGFASSDMADAIAAADAAEAAFRANQFEEAATGWTSAAELFAAQVAMARSEADAAREEAEAGGDGVSEAAAILAKSYRSRASAAYDAGEFRAATALYRAAFAVQDAAPVTGAGRGGDVETRSVALGDAPALLEAAVRLCREAAPIDPSNCPAARGADEAARSADITPFSLDAMEVGVGEFRNFVEATGYRTVAETSGQIIALTSSGEARMINGGYTWATPEGEGSSASAGLPVTNISFQDAAAYCEWAGGRLPSEAEWEATARDFGETVFPWGGWAAGEPVWRGAPDPARRLLNPSASAGGAGPSGHQGLSGNVREWVVGADGAVLKGGSWNTANPADLRISARLIVPGNAPGVDFGFRCARDLEAWP